MLRSGTRTWLVAAATAGSVALTVPSSGTAGAPTATATVTSSTGAADAERIVVLGEEDVLGDLLALGIVPIAATASVPDAGFHALDGYDTSTIEPLPVDLSLERLAGLDPDLIVTLQFWLDQVPAGTLESVAPVVVVPDGLDSASQVTFLGEQFRARNEAAALTTELKHAQAEAAATLEGVEVTVAAIYPGPTPAVFVDGPWVVPQVLIDAGARLLPAAGGGLEADENGRVYLSMEQIDLLSAPHVVLMQSDLVEGESDAVDQLTGSPLWARLPAVDAGNVHVVDRLGYPGIEGHLRAIAHLVDLLAATTSATTDLTDGSSDLGEATR